MRYTILESAWELGRRPQFKGAKLQVINGYQVRTAVCGCINSTALVGDRVSGDGVTSLCDEHAYAGPEDEE